MDNTTIQKFLDEHDYDIRKTHNGRWIDQKCTMDVVCLVSDCIVEYTSNREDKRFTVNDIWYSDYTVENVQQIFSKPNPTQKASNEYDKYFGQPIKLLDAAGVIHGEKSGRGYTYSIVNQELLEYISFRERNSFNFLCLYIEKVLKDSGLYRIFEYFFRLQDKNSFRELYNENRELLGKDHIRGEQLPIDGYHLVVHVWIRNSKGQYLISQRSANKPTYSLMWECVGGSVVKGEDSLQGAIREAKEEVGVDLMPENGQVLFTKTRKIIEGKIFNDIMDVWLFEYDGEVDLGNATTDEVTQVAWMNREQIKELFDANMFVDTLEYFFTEVDKK